MSAGICSQSLVCVGAIAFLGGAELIDTEGSSANERACQSPCMTRCSVPSRLLHRRPWG